LDCFRQDRFVSCSDCLFNCLKTCNPLNHLMAGEILVYIHTNNIIIINKSWDDKFRIAFESVCLSLYLSIHGFTALLYLCRFFIFLIYTQSVGLLERGISPSQGRYLHPEQHKYRINAQLSMSQMGFKPTIPVFEWAKTVHALDRAATVIG
jgi:hypothetical protein